MKTRLAAAAAFAGLLLAAPLAQAETLAIPSDAPVASITFPDDWNTEETESGAQSFSADETISLYADIASGESVEQVVTDAATFLVENGVTVDTATETRAEGELNGLPATSIAWKGTDESGTVDVSLTAVVLSDKDIVVFTYWASEGAADANKAALDTITNSVKPAGQ